MDDRNGLSEQIAAQRLLAEGPNEMPAEKHRSWIAIVMKLLREPMLMLLVACSVIYLLLGDRTEAYLLMGSALLIICITYYQEHRSERALEALRDLSSPRALVIRDRISKRIAGREVVREDLVVVAEGDRVPADAALVQLSGLEIDESLLTGESLPVQKSAWDGQQAIARPGGNSLPFIYSGTLVVKGRGIAKVVATGPKTEMGRIGAGLQSVKEEGTKVQKEVRRLVSVLAIIGIALCVLVAILYVIVYGNWLQGFLSGLSLAMAMVPEEFPVIITIFLALGAWRMSKRNILTRRIPAIESLGETTILCVDKTGTLTENKMVVRELRTLTDTFTRSDAGTDTNTEVPTFALPESFIELAKGVILATPRDPFDPMEKAILSFGSLSFEKQEYPGLDSVLKREYPLSSELLAVTNVWQSGLNGPYVVAAKGAVEAISELCHLQGEIRDKLESVANEMAQEGLRVLAVAKGVHINAELPGTPRDFDFEILGLVGLYDPPRKSVPAALAECYQAGIRVMMITGDYPPTARAIARQIGLRNPDSVITGAELATLDETRMAEKLSGVSICARVLPEQKLQIVQALKRRGEIVVMTGDGVNDAPALKSANIGIAMGGRGTDVAREAASLVLLGDDFASIVEAIRNGRRIFGNLQRAMSYIIAIHIPTAGMAILPLLFGMPIALYPMHIVFLELIIDPACSIAFEAEPEDDQVMKLPPRSPTEKLLSWRRLDLSMLQGVSSLVICFAVFALALHLNRGAEESRALSFATLIFSNLALILTNRSWTSSMIASFRKKNVALGFVLVGGLSLLGLVLYFPPFEKTFHFTTLHTDDILICLAAGILSVLWFETLKYYRARRKAAL